MSRRPTRPECVAALAGLTLLASAVVAVAQAPLPDSVFGYAVGEERRYLLGPPDALGSAEYAEWGITLDRIDERDGSTVAIFSFQHERFETIPGSFDPSGSVMTVNVEGRLVTNLAGFPLDLEYRQRFRTEGGELSGTGDRSIGFAYGDGHYKKTIQAGTRDWDFKVNVPNHKHLDRDAPRGLYTWMPTALACLGTARATCIEHDPAFANPGFFSFIVAPLLEMEDSEREFLFFQPAGVSNSPFRIMTTGRWMSRERNNINNLQRYFETTKVKLGPSTEVEVGPRTMHAWEIDMCCGVEKIYVEPEGRVLKVELESTMLVDERWIRLVFPFEEFTTNPDPVLQKDPRR